MKLRMLVLDDVLPSVGQSLDAALRPYLAAGTAIPMLRGGEIFEILLNDIDDLPASLSITCNQGDTVHGVLEEIEQGEFAGEFDLVLLDDQWAGDKYGGHRTLLQPVFSGIKGPSPELPVIVWFTQEWEETARTESFNRTLSDKSFAGSQRIVPCPKRDGVYSRFILQNLIRLKHLIEERDQARREVIQEKQLRRVFGIPSLEQCPQTSPVPYIVGSSVPMRAVYYHIERCAISNLPVCIYGRTGSGKDNIPRAIHELGRGRQGKPYFKYQLSQGNDDLVASELFGYKRGSHSTAYSDKLGLLKVADGGTLFLDEIHTTSLATQVKLHRFLDSGEFLPVGGTKVEHSSARVICATNEDLAGLVEKGEFREDLFYRINASEPIRLVPLAQRKEDIPDLIRFFVTRICTQHSAPVPNITPETMRRFQDDYSWPGNVRQLMHLIENHYKNGWDEYRFDRTLLSYLSEDSESSRVDREQSPSHPFADILARHPEFTSEGLGKAIHFLDQAECAAKQARGRLTQEMLATAMKIASRNRISQITSSDEIGDEIRVVLESRAGWDNARAAVLKWLRR